MIPVHGGAPLEGVVVLDLTEYVAGPYGTMMLADLGADVIKVEPIEGDHWRRQQPVVGRESRYFIGVNRGKRSIALDLEKPAGRAVFDRMVPKADVVVVNHRPSTLERLRLRYEDVARLRPDIIYCSITAFGERGPYSGRPGFDLLVQALTGMMDFERKVERGVPVGITSFAPADLSTGMYAAFAIASALYRRALTGEGQRIELSLFAVGLAIQYRPMLQLERYDREPRERMLAAVHAAREHGRTYEEMLTFRTGLGLQRATAPYYRVYQTADSLIAVACLNNRQRRKLCEVLGIDDPAVQGEVFELAAALPAEEHEAKMRRFEAAFRERTTAEWLQRLEAADVPAVPVLLTEEVFDHPQAAENDLFYTLEHPAVGPIRQPKPPVRMEPASVGAPRPAPMFSADAAAILAWAGLSEGEIAELVRGGVVRLPGE
ncbi:Acetyl-CoA:oxalate CoA-transferase [bacterium HR29]|mgnify:CR=1 FL=1|jgi:CoA:oxalate CoA-transferase|nr:Acetyl-CoA:oxalate CoA-transferase [bacterium HR29]